MKGSYDQGVFTITWDAQTEKLRAPDGKIYIPCCECSTVLACEENTVTIICPKCFGEDDLARLDGPVAEPALQEETWFEKNFVTVAGHIRKRPKL